MSNWAPEILLVANWVPEFLVGNWAPQIGPRQIGPQRKNGGKWVKVSFRYDDVFRHYFCGDIWQTGCLYDKCYLNSFEIIMLYFCLKVLNGILPCLRVLTEAVALS